MSLKDPDNILKPLVEQIRDGLEPIARSAGDQAVRREILLALGLDPAAAGTPIVIPPGAMASIDQYRERDAGDIDVRAFISVLADITQVTQALIDFIRSVAAAPDAQRQPGFVVDEAVSFFLDAIVLSYLRNRSPGVYITAHAFKLLEDQGIRYGGISQLMFRTGSFFGELWGSAADLQTDEDARIVSDVALLVTGIVAASLTDAEFVYGYDPPPGPGTLADAASNRTLTLKISGKIKDSDENEVKGSIVLGVVLVPSEHGGPGIASRVQLNGSIEIPVTKNVSVKIDAPVPDFFVYIPTDDPVPGRTPPAFPASTDAGLKLTLAYKSKPDKDIIWFNPKETHLRIGTSKLEGGLGVKDQNFKFEVKDSALVLATEKTDGFLNKMLGAVTSDGKLQAKFDFDFGYKKKKWFVGGGMGLLMTIPLHQKLAYVKIDTLTVGLALAFGDKSGKEPGIKLEASVSLTMDLAGGLVASVDRVGLAGVLKFEEGKFSLGFKPPNGVGLKVSIGPVSGSGFLLFDPDREEYAGALELDICGLVKVTALGLITTRLPDGGKGFSLIGIVAVERKPPDTLPLKFIFIGLGLILGLNRTMRLEAIAEGIKSGGLERILFPENIAANAARIISDLRTFFPPSEGTLVVGLMLKMGWGTKNLVTLSVGVVVQVPPGTFAILGVLKVASPSEKAPVIQIKVGFLGAYEPDRKRAWFFATLYDSRILMMTIEGGVGVLVDWSEDANFILSIGGFHPQFRPPELPFPTPDRLAIDILHTPLARIRAMAYVAVTSNTMQFGIRAEVYFGFKSSRLEGHLGLDALLQFSPFYLIVEISAAVSLKVFGAGLFTVRLRGSFEGFTPKRLQGAASISLLFLSVDVNIDHTWGERRDTTLPAIAALPLLVAELEKESSWRALPPRNAQLGVSLRPLDTGDRLVLHPVGELVVSQHALPLNLTIDRVGPQKVTDASHFTVTPAGAAGDGLALRGTQQERFALGQFQDLSDTEKLSRPAFERVPGGVRVGVAGNQNRSSRMVKRRVRYETIIIDTEYKRHVRSFFAFWDRLFTHFLDGAAVTKVELSQKNLKQKQPFPDRVEVGQTGFAVANLTDNKAVGGTVAFASEALAREFMRQRVAADPAEAARLHVIPRYEVNAAP